MTLDDHAFPTDLIVLMMTDFDVILGNDWSTKYHANLDCVNKSITFSLLGSPSCTSQCSSLIDAILTTHVVAIEGIRMEITIAQVLVLYELNDILQIISRLPSKRDIDFSIELMPETIPISKPHIVCH